MGKNDTPEVRLDQMAIWAAGVNEQLADLTAAMIVTTEKNADSISLQLADLVSQCNAAGEDYANALKNKAEAGLEITQIKKNMADIEAPLMLEISIELMPDGKKLRYSNDSLRAAAMRESLKENEGWHGLDAQLVQAEATSARARAVIASIDAEEKLRGRKIDALVARLNNLTARVK